MSNHGHYDRNYPRCGPSAKHRALTSIAAAALCLGFSASALAAPPKQINLANRTDPSGTYALGFCSRPSPVSAKGWPGHAFISFSNTNQSGHDFVGVGLTLSSTTSPAQAAWSLFGSAVTGRLKDEVYTSVHEDCLIVQVNKEDYERAYAFTLPPLEKLGLARNDDIVFQYYKLASEDCVAFVIEVAKSLTAKGLKVPDRNTLEGPVAFVQRLIAAN